MVVLDAHGLKDGGRPHFRFDPTVNLGHVLTFISMLAAGVAVYADVRSDIRTHSTKLAATEKLFDSQIEDMRRTVSSTNEGLNRVERKVDTILTQTRR